METSRRTAARFRRRRPGSLPSLQVGDQIVISTGMLLGQSSGFLRVLDADNEVLWPPPSDYLGLLFIKGGAAGVVEFAAFLANLHGLNIQRLECLVTNTFRFALIAPPSLSATSPRDASSAPSHPQSRRARPGFRKKS